MTILNVSVRIETADDAAAETAYDQVKTALAGFDDIPRVSRFPKKKRLINIAFLGRNPVVSTCKTVLSL